MANLNGTSASEALIGTADADVINGKTAPASGSDTLLGLAGDDALYGGVEVQDFGVVDRLDGGDGNDVLNFDVDRSDGLATGTLLGGAGDDAVSVSWTYDPPEGFGPMTGAITVDGGMGADTLTVSDQLLQLLPRLTITGFEQLTIANNSSDIPRGGVPLTVEQVAGVSGKIVFDYFYDLQLPYEVRLTDGGVADFSATQITPGLVIDAAPGASATIIGTTGADVIRGGDATTLASAHYVFYGASGNDVLSLGATTSGFNSLYGGDGADTLNGSGAPGDLIDGGAGVDAATIFLVEPAGLTLHLDDLATATGVTFADDTTIRNVEKVSISLSGAGDAVYAASSGSAIYLSGGGTKAYGGAGDDTLSADDVYVTPGGHDRASANTGTVHIDYSGATAPVYMNSTSSYSRAGAYFNDEAWVGGSARSDAGSAASVNFLTTAEVFGSAFGDTLVTDQHTTSSGASPQIDLYGGLGNDTLFAGPHAAILDGGAGVDTLDFSVLGAPSGAYGAPPPPGITVDLSITVGQGTGYGADAITGVENVVGSQQGDQITGDAGANLLNGGAGNDTLSGGAGNDSLAGGPGADLLFGGDGDDTAVFNFSSALAGFQHVGATLVVSGPDGSDTLAGVEHLQFADGVLAPALVNDHAAPQPDAPQTIGGAYFEVGGSGSDFILGTGGDDTIQGGPGSDTISASDGDDTAVYVGRSLFYQITTPAQASFSDFYVAGGDEGGTDDLRGVDNLRFLDGTLTFDPNSEAAQIYRLYDTFLNRAPDTAGFDAYQQYLASGHTLHDAAVNASASPEFQAAASSLSNADFVAYIYENTLDRAPDAYGLQQYTALLDGGESRVDFAFSVIESAEHIQHTSAAVYAGLWTPDVPASGLALLYDTLFQREPDAYGIKAYEAELAAGTTFREIANQSVGSAEYQARYGGTTDKQFVDQLYENTVHREPDAYGENAYLQELSHGYTRGDVIWQVSISAEHESYVLSHPDPSLFVF